LICLSVPRILNETELITKPMPPHLRGNRLVSGVNVLSDGTLALVLNPAALSSSVKSKSSELETEERPKKRILVVDDSLIARELLSNILIAFDYDVSLARDGKEALQFLKMHVVDLIISDVDMPNMNGYALAKFIKSDKELQLIPIIIITAKESNRDRMEGLEIGADEYLYKGSFNQQNLIDTVEQLLEKTKP
jgi:two-component system, chemotaxis family, sensor kinase CheA